MRKLLLVALVLVPSIALAAPSTKKRISLDVQDAEITNILRLMADVSGKNFVIDDDVTGKVTVKLRNVKWTSAFEVILKSKGLGVEKFGDNIYRIAKREKLNSEEQAVLDLEVKRADKLPLRTKIIPVNYAKAKDIAKQMETFLTKRGTVSFDERTNTVILKDVVNSPVFRK